MAIIASTSVSAPASSPVEQSAESPMQGAVNAHRHRWRTECASRALHGWLYCQFLVQHQRPEWRREVFLRKPYDRRSYGLSGRRSKPIPCYGPRAVGALFPHDLPLFQLTNDAKSKRTGKIAGSQKFVKWHGRGFPQTAQGVQVCYTYRTGVEGGQARIGEKRPGPQFSGGRC